MSSKVGSKQLIRRRFGFFFIFRIRPNFFVGFVPRRLAVFANDYDPQYDDEMVVERIEEKDYMFLQSLGVPEVRVQM